MDLRTENAWIYLLLLFILTDTVSVITLGQQCGPSQYLVDGLCKNCTNCSEVGRDKISNCTDSSNAVCSQNSSECMEGEFLNETKQCQACKVCGDHEEESKACSATKDRECVPRCTDPFVWVERQGCVLNCMLCPSKHCADTQSCMCNPSSNPDPCYADITCNENICTDPTSVPTNNNNPGSSSDNSLPTWGIGLVAIGIVIGIVAFSGCFLAMGFFTSRSREPQEIGSEESQTSQNGLVTPSIHRNSASTRLTFVSSPVFSQSTIEVLRNSPRLSPCSKPRHGGSSHKASPHSMRNNPRGNSPRRHSPKRSGHITPV